jgi:glutamine amidotransferase
VIDYGAGNLRSVVRALAKVGATLDTMQSLQRLELVEAIGEVIRAQTPFLGICVGMQVLCEQSEEFGPHACLGVVAGSVRRLPGGQKVPQIGWNQVGYANNAGAHPIFASIPENSDFYFVHSYYCDLADQRLVAGTTDYGLAFPSALLDGNLAAVQFHPEKSGRWGLQLLTNFVSWAAGQQ